MKRLSLLFLLPFTNALIKGISYFGLETPLADMDCSWSGHSHQFYISKLNELGFNYLRIPFSQEYVRNDKWNVMDEIFDLSLQYNMSILLDYHRTYSDHQGDWWETNMTNFINTWGIILNHDIKTDHN